VLLFPAIDLRGGRVVRLRQGDFADETVYGDEPVAVAVGFAEEGAAWIHVVDLDAARTGQPVNRPIIGAIGRVLARRGTHVQAGGGVRNEAAASALWEAGVTRVVIGTAAVEDPDLVTRLCRAHPGGVAVGLDTRDGEVATRGWESRSGLRLSDALSRVADAGVAAVVVTDIGRDAMLTGPDLSGLATALDLTTVDVIASGGVSSVNDLIALTALFGPRSHRTLAGAIVGKAIYEGRFTVAEGVAACAVSA
jgi:phosphoribosylformimino-5-aminoimidazole carboxamide ribotide isomerase